MKFPHCTPECLPDLDAHSAACLSAAGDRPRADALPLPQADCNAVEHHIEDAPADLHPAPPPSTSPNETSTYEDSPTLFTCHICEQPIGKFRIQAGNHDVCVECGNCAECGEQVTISEINWAIKHSVRVMHARCRIRVAPQTMIPVSAQELELLNLCRLIVCPDSDLSVETNQLRAKTAHTQLWENMSMEKKFLHTQMMEAIYSSCYVALKKDPKEIALTKLEKAQRVAEETSKIREKDIKIQRSSLPSEKKKMNAQEQFLAGMLKSGVTKPMAIEIWKSQGKVWVE